MNNNQEPLLKKNFFRLLLLTFAGSIIYGLPYFRPYFYESYQNMYNLTNVQTGSLGSAYGMLGLVSYLIGGVISDKFSTRTLLTFSLVATGLGGLVHYFTTSYGVLLVVYGLWGVTSLLTFWPALVKAIRMLGTSDEQGRLFGIFEGGRGIINSLHTALAIGIFAFITKKTTENAGLKAVIMFYSIVTIASGIMIFFTIKDDTKSISTPETNESLLTSSLESIVTILKLPTVWVITIIMSMSYVFNISYTYFTPYATDVFKATAVFGSILALVAEVCRPIASLGAGFASDKIGRANVLMIGFVLLALGVLGIMLVPIDPKNTIFLTVAAIIVYFGMYSNYGIIFSLMDEGDIPLELSGLAVGFISTIGYLPEVIVPIIAGRTLDKYSGVTGYNLFFMFMIICAITGFIFSLIWSKKYSKKVKKTPNEQVQR